MLYHGADDEKYVVADALMPSFCVSELGRYCEKYVVTDEGCSVSDICTALGRY